MRVVVVLELVVQDRDDEAECLAGPGLGVEDYVLAQDGVGDAQLLAECQFGLLQKAKSVHNSFV